MYVSAIIYCILNGKLLRFLMIFCLLIPMGSVPSLGGGNPEHCRPVTPHCVLSALPGCHGRALLQMSLLRNLSHS